jgi:hypothetical protein
VNVPTNRPRLSVKETAALQLIQATWPGSAFGPFEPFEPDGEAGERRKGSVLAEADEELAEDRKPTSSWRHVELSEYLEPDDGAGVPSVLSRTDGSALLYAGKRNEIHAPHESAKSFLAQQATVECLRRAEAVVYVDLEDGPRSLVARLLALGATEAEILNGFRYIAPDVPLSAQRSST